MSAKSSKIGLVSLFAVLAMALGGCAESVDQGRTSVPGRNLTPFPDTAILAAPPASEIRGKSEKIELASAAGTTRTNSAVARSGVGYRTDGCGH